MSTAKTVRAGCLFFPTQIGMAPTINKITPDRTERRRKTPTMKDSSATGCSAAASKPTRQITRHAGLQTLRRIRDSSR
jgi:hypothetical protein